MKKFLTTVFLAAMVMGIVSPVAAKSDAPTGSPDSISSASPMYYSNEAVIRGADGKTKTALTAGIRPFWAAGSAELKAAMSGGYDVVAPTISTTNKDGSPNVAVYNLTPVTGTDYQYMSFKGGNASKTITGDDKGNSFVNLRDRKLGVVMYYLHRPERFPRTVLFTADGKQAIENDYKGFKYLRNQGARVIVQLVEDEAVLKDLKAKAGDTGDATLYVKVVKVFPMG